MVGRITVRKKTRKQELERKRKISKAVTAKQRGARTPGGLSDRDRLELARARGGAGQQFAIEDRKLTSTTKEERGAEDVKAIAKRSFEIEEEKKRLGTEKIIIEEKTKRTEEEERLIETGEVSAEAIRVRRLAEEAGVLPGQEGAAIGQALQQPKSNLVGEPRFTDQPSAVQAYQKTLLSIVTTSTTAKGITTGGKGITQGLKVFSKFAGTKLGARMIKAGAGLVTFSGIMIWLASDNIVGTMSIYGRDLAEDVQWNRIDSDVALEKFDEGQGFIDYEKSFVRYTTALNPLLWPFRKIILLNMATAQLSMDENRQRITGVREISREPPLPPPIPEEQEEVI